MTMAIDVKIVSSMFDKTSIPTGHEVVVVAHQKWEWEQAGWKTGTAYLVPKSVVSRWRFGADIPDGLPAVPFADDPRDTFWTAEAVANWQNRNIKAVRDHNANSTHRK